MLFVYAISVLIAATWILLSIQEKKILWRNHFLLPFMAVFLLSQILSTVFSIHIPTSLHGYYSRFHGGLLSSVAYLVLLQAAISLLRKKDVRPLIRSILVAALGVCLWAIPEHFGVSPSCFLISGEWNVQCWKQDVQSRVFASFGQPNWLAAYLLVTIPLGMWFWLTQPISTKNSLSWKNIWQQYWPLVGVLLGGCALAFTRSRSGSLGLLVGMGTFAFLLLFWKYQRESLFSWTKNSLKQTFLGVSAILVPILLFGFYTWKGLENELKSSKTETEQTEILQGTQLDTGGTDSGKIRMIVWEGAIHVWKRYPILGSGVETFAYSYYQDRPREHNDVSEWDFLYNKAHNEFLNFLATTGIFGLLSYLAFLSAWMVHAFWYGIFLNRKSFKLAAAASALIAASAGLAASNFLGFSTVFTGLLFFLLPAFWILVFTDSQTETEPELRSPPLSVLQWTGVAFTLLVSVWILSLIWQTWNQDRVLAISKAALNMNQGQLAYTTAVQLTERNPNQPLFWEQRSLTMARLALGMADQDATLAAQLANDADLSSQTMLQLNPRHVNFWKSRVRILLFLAAFDESFYNDTRSTLQQARELAPTDAKLVYNLGLVEQTLGNVETARALFEEALQLRPNYIEAQESLDSL